MKGLLLFGIAFLATREAFAGTPQIDDTMYIFGACVGALLAVLAVFWLLSFIRNKIKGNRSEQVADQTDQDETDPEMSENPENQYPGF